MGRTFITLPNRTHRAWAWPVAIGTAVVIVGAATAWAFFVPSSDRPARSVPAAGSSRTASQGPRTDPIPVDPSGVSETMLVVQGYVDSLNRWDIAGAVGAFAAEGALSSPRCQPPCVGAAAIASVPQQNADTHGNLTLTNPRVEGDTLTAHFSVTSPELPAGVERFIGTMTAVVHNQKIVLLKMDWDTTDPQTAAVLDVLNQR